MKKFIAFCLSLTMGCTIFAGCGKADKDKKEKTNEKKSTTTTTVAETTATEKAATTTTAAEDSTSVSDSYDEPNFEVINERTLDDGTEITIYQSEKESSLSVSIEFGTDDIVSNLIIFTNCFSALQEETNESDFFKSIVVYGNYDGKTRCANEVRKRDGEYKSAIGTIFYDEEYENTYNSIMDGTIDLSEYTTSNSESDSKPSSTAKVTTTKPTTTTSKPDPKAEEYTSIYEDDNVKIEFYGIETKSYDECVAFYVTNKNDFEITIQCSSISLDGIQIDGDPIMSDEVAPQSKAKVYARYDSIENKNPSTVSGVLRIIDFSREYFDSYDVTFINVEVN